MTLMPAIFIGHGSPMNAIEENQYSEFWKKLGQELPRPKAILCISAHWYTDGTLINDAQKPKTIYDMYGFPKALYEIVYGAPGAPELARDTKDLIKTNPVKVDNTWGFDHGTWSVLHRMYPQADIPVYQLSVDRNAHADLHFQIGKELKELREKGVLILGSGNVVHNLGQVDFSVNGGFDWAQTFDDYIKEQISNRDFDAVINYKKVGKPAQLAVPTPDHFFPLLYVLGASKESDNLSIHGNSCIYGSLSMTSYVFSEI